MQQTDPVDEHDPLLRPPILEQTLAKTQIPASALGETQVVPSSQFKLEANVDRGEFDTKLLNGLFLKRGSIRLSVSPSLFKNKSLAIHSDG